MRAAAGLVLIAAAVSCARARSAFHSTDSFSFTHGTEQVAGCTVPPTSWDDVARLAPGVELVVHASDFDRRVMFEAIISIEDVPRVLVLEGGRVALAGSHHLSFLARVLRAEGLQPALSTGPYEQRVESLRAVVRLDPLVGLSALATERQALFHSHVGELARAALRHRAVNLGVLEWLAELCLGPVPRHGPLRGYLAVGGARRLLEEVARHPAASRDLVARVALRSMEETRDAELVVLACLSRHELEPADLAAILLAAMAKLGTSGERARVAREVCGHPRADGAVLATAIGQIGRLSYSSHRSEMLAAAAAGAHDGATLAAVVAAVGEVEFESDQERVLNDVALNPRCTDEIRVRMKKVVDRLKSETIRARLYALLRR